MSRTKRTYTSTDDDEDLTCQLGIPRNIMITWKSSDPSKLPEHWKPAYASIKKYMSHWNLHFMDDKDLRNLVVTYAPWYLPTYDAFPYHIQRVDVSRYLWLYVYGGLYLDLDYQLTRNIDELFIHGDLFLISSPNISGSLTNSLMASRAKHPVWMELLQYTTKPIPWYAKLNKTLRIMRESGPQALNNVVNSSKYPYTKLPSKLCNPCNICQIGRSYYPDAWLLPLQGGSWVGIDGKIFNYIYCNYTWLVPIIVIMVIVLIVLLLMWVYRKGQQCRVRRDTYKSRTVTR